MSHVRGGHITMSGTGMDLYHVRGRKELSHVRSGHRTMPGTGMDLCQGQSSSHVRGRAEMSDGTRCTVVRWQNRCATQNKEYIHDTDPN